MRPTEVARSRVERLWSDAVRWAWWYVRGSPGKRCELEADERGAHWRKLREDDAYAKRGQHTSAWLS